MVSQSGQSVYQYIWISCWYYHSSQVIFSQPWARAQQEWGIYNWDSTSGMWRDIYHDSALYLGIVTRQIRKESEQEKEIEHIMPRNLLSTFQCGDTLILHVVQTNQTDPLPPVDDGFP